MKTRTLPDTWIHGKKNPIKAFANVSQDIYEALLGIEKHYKDFFNQHSAIKIEDYINIFNETYEEIVECAMGDFLKYDFLGKETHPLYEKKLNDWNESYRFNCFESSHCRSGFFAWKEDYDRQTTMFLAPEYKEQFCELANKIFNVENHVFPFVQKIWQKELKNTDNIFQNKPAFALIKVLDNWRDDRTNRAHLDKRVATSTSLISSENLGTFHDGEAHIAISYKLNDGLLASYPSDAFLHEDVKFSSIKIRDTQSHATTLVHKIYDSEQSQAYANYGCKIYTPKHLMELTNKGSYNEVIVDSTVAEPTSVILFTYNNVKPEKDFRIAKQLADRLGLPLNFIDKGYTDFKESKLRDDARTM